MHNFAVIQLQILTLILPENTGMNMKEAPSVNYWLGVPLIPPPFIVKLNSPLFTKHILLPFVSVQIHLKPSIERSNLS